jgi:hypothetical protein
MDPKPKDTQTDTEKPDKPDEAKPMNPEERADFEENVVHGEKGARDLEPPLPPPD